MELTSKERLLRALNHGKVDRPPVIIPGGMMAGTFSAIITEDALPYPAIHTHTEAMVNYARLLQHRCGMDNYGVPFCMTIEAEDFGARVDLGSPLVEPRVIEYLGSALDDLLSAGPASCSRHTVTLEAIRRLSGSDIPVVGNLTGPMSLLTSLVEPTVCYRALARDRGTVARALDIVTDHILAFAIEQMDAGADALVLADPGSAGDILGGYFFSTFVAPCLKRIAKSVKARRIPFILHICGNIFPLSDFLADIPWDALSVDSVVGLRRLQAHFPGRALMGNISTHVVATAKEDSVYRACRKALEISVILAPACGLPTTSPPQNLRAMLRAAKETAGTVKSYQ
jgi:MtaA/CmuA family methyltransferase